MFEARLSTRCYIEWLHVSCRRLFVQCRGNTRVAGGIGIIITRLTYCYLTIIYSPWRFRFVYLVTVVTSSLWCWSSWYYTITFNINVDQMVFSCKFKFSKWIEWVVCIWRRFEQYFSYTVWWGKWLRRSYIITTLVRSTSTGLVLRNLETLRRLCFLKPRFGQA